MKENRINSLQQKFLRERLASIMEAKPKRYDEIKIEKSAAVVKAERQLKSAQAVIAKFSKMKDAARDKRRQAVRAAYDDCMQRILFGSADEAIAALDRFASKKF